MKKIILRTLEGIVIFVILLTVAAYMFLKFYVVPKYSSVADDIIQSEMLTEADITATKGIWSEHIETKIEAIPTPTPEPTPTPVPKKSGSVPKKSQVKGATAKERIMSTATQDEISAGAAILAKVNLGKVYQLQSEGKTAELKKYIKSVLTSAEINKALALYAKYKHLL